MVAPLLQFDREVCAVCGQNTADGHFMRIYLEGGRLDFCSPVCARVYNLEPERFGAPHRDLPPPGWRERSDAAESG
jgi:hypothetical protein